MPDLTTMEQTSVRDQSSNRSKAETIGQSEGGREEKWGVGFVACWIGDMFSSQDFGDIVHGLSVIPNIVVADWKIRTIPYTTIVYGTGDDPEKEDNTNQGVSNRVPWGDKWTLQSRCNLRPVESNRDQTDTSCNTKELIDNDIVWSNPSHKRKVTETLEDHTREPGVVNNEHDLQFEGNTHQYQRKEAVNMIKNHL